MIKSKLSESLHSILPIALIVFALSLTITPIGSGYMLIFLIGIAFLVFGMSLFNMGAEMSMQPLGVKIGSSIASSGKIWLIAFISFIIGIIITISEPDLTILANQVSDVENLVLILTVSVGVGIFLVIALLRIVFGFNLNIILAVFYLVAFALAFLLPESFRPLAFDSGGVTTGPMTVPFIMSLGAGVSSARLSKSGRDDSFGITALCSIGPIISVLVLGIVADINGGGQAMTLPSQPDTTRDGIWEYCTEIVHYAEEVALALLPIVVFTVIFQLVTHAFSKTQLIRIFIGVIYTFVGLAIFLTGANVGFMPTGMLIGQGLASIHGGWLLIPIGMLLGFFIVKAEPAVYVLNRLVEEMSAGAISGKLTGLGLSVGVSAAIGLSALRILTGISIMYILIPGYLLAFILCFLVPKMFVGIAFDSGGVASGTMMSGFVLPLAIGACTSENVAGDVMTDAFGCVAFVAMAPIIAIQLFGLVYTIKSRRRKRSFISKSESFVEYPRAQRVKKESAK